MITDKKLSQLKKFSIIFFSEVTENHFLFPCMKSPNVNEAKASALFKEKPSHCAK